METMNNKLKVSELTEQEKYVLSQNAELNLQNDLKVNKDLKNIFLNLISSGCCGAY